MRASPWLLAAVAALPLVLAVPAEARGTRVRVPDVRQQSVSRALHQLGRLGLVGRVIGPSSGAGERVVISQSPAPGHQARAGATVRLTIRWVRNGQAPPASPGQSNQVVVPNVIGQTPHAAMLRLRRVGLGARLVGGVEHGFVVGQNPAAGRTVRRGAQVRLSVRGHRR